MSSNGVDRVVGVPAASVAGTALEPGAPTALQVVYEGVDVPSVILLWHDGDAILYEQKG